ncbi:MAG: formylglycine-generating enzyme family protein [Spirochaetes bacterium]|nr:formylglycine-generating enzyme family protein [Spirochaetota bacterium]
MNYYLHLNKFLLIFVLVLASVFGIGACGSGGGGVGGGGGDVGDGGDGVLPKKIEGMVWINPGAFSMGQNDISGATPVHSVTLTKGFYMSKYQVTQEQYAAVMATTNPSNFNGDSGKEPAEGEIQGKRPVENVTWYDAVEFCNKLSDLEGLDRVYEITGRTPASGYPITSATVTVLDWTNNGYRLPTEAEWEYACRAGTTTAYNTGDTISNNTGWYDSNSENKTHEVGKKPANDWGLYDMHGNVYEWCGDLHETYSGSAVLDPRGPEIGSDRVIRGGAWLSDGQSLRSASRHRYNPGSRYYNTGFRVARSL